MPTDFGFYLREIRKKRGLNIDQLSAASGISAAQISRIETGKRKTPQPQTIKKLSIPLDADFEEMMKLAGHLES